MMQRPLRRAVSLGLILSALLMLPACNTVHGLGKDIEQGGQKIQDTTGKKAQDW